MSISVSALDKLVDHVASGIGSVAGSMLAPWRAEKEARARQITTEADARTLLIHATAQAEARQILLSPDDSASGVVNISDRVQQRLLFQEEKRQANIESVVRQAADHLDEKTAADGEPDHDWTARFFNNVQDVSSQEMQTLWARVLAGEVERSGSTSVRTLEILRNLDHATAKLFRRLCSVCVFLTPNDTAALDARVPSLGGNAAHNALSAHGLSFNVLNRLNEHGLIISDYNSWFDYQLAIRVVAVNDQTTVRLPFSLQGRKWILVPHVDRKQAKEHKLTGVALTTSGRELARVVELEPGGSFVQELQRYFLRDKLQMLELPKPPDRSRELRQPG